MFLITLPARRQAATPSALLLLALLAAFAGPAPAETPEEQKARIQRIEEAVLAPCCYTEPVSRHQSEIALKMRVEIAKWVAAGKTDQEILDTYVRQYGAKVLVDPRTKPAWWTPWIPWLVLMLGVVLVLRILKRWRSRRLPPGLPSDLDDRHLPDIDGEESPEMSR